MKNQQYSIYILAFVALFLLTTAIKAQQQKGDFTLGVELLPALVAANNEDVNIEVFAKYSIRPELNLKLSLGYVDHLDQDVIYFNLHDHKVNGMFAKLGPSINLVNKAHNRMFFGLAYTLAAYNESGTFIVGDPEGYWGTYNVSFNERLVRHGLEWDLGYERRLARNLFFGINPRLSWVVDNTVIELPFITTLIPGTGVVRTEGGGGFNSAQIYLSGHISLLWKFRDKGKREIFGGRFM